MLKHCGVSGVKGIANGKEEGTNSVEDVRENSMISDLKSSTSRSNAVSTLRKDIFLVVYF